jgi:hypothetical protein
MSDKLKIIQFVKKANKDSDELSANEILEGSMNMLDVALIIGKEKNGDPFFVSTTTDIATILLMIKELEYDLLTPTYYDE